MSVEKEKAPVRKQGPHHQHPHQTTQESASEFSSAFGAETITDLPVPDTDAAVRFLQQFRPGGPWVLAAISPSGEKPKVLTMSFGKDRVSDMAHWVQSYQGKRNLYFHVNPTMRPLSKKAAKSDVASLDWLHVDIDPRPGEDVHEERERALSLLTTALPKGVPAPTVIVDSGGGYQAYWRLETAEPIDGDVATAEELERYTRHLEAVFGADNCHNVDRIMRLPDTVNVPDAKKRKKGRKAALARLVTFTENSYSLGEFQQAPATKAVVPSKGGEQSYTLPDNRPQLESVDELDQWGVPDWCKVLIVQGNDPDNPSKYPSRSEAYYHCACELVRCEVPDEVIASVLLDESHGIAEGPREKRNPEQYVARQIAKAHEEKAKQDAEPAWNPTNKHGGPVRGLHNTVVALQRLGLKCSHDLFRRCNNIGHHELQEFAGEFSDLAEVMLRKLIRERFGFDPGKDYVKDAVLELCAGNTYDALRDHLSSLPKWDGKQRLDSWLCAYLGVEDNSYTREAGALWMLGAVARALQPGVKFDHMLVLVGAQGVGKSTALRILAGDEFFSDANFLGARDSREVLEATEGAWIVECAELAGMHRKDAETLKYEITKQEDRGRPAYARNPVTVPRRFVLAGTTNSPRFLQDETGNRRFWPVEAAETDLEALARDRDQLWAEALARYEASGGRCRLFLTGEAKRLAEAAQEGRRKADDGLVEQLENIKAEGRYKDVLAVATETVYGLLGIPNERRRGKLATDVQQAMRVLGWEPTPNVVHWLGKKRRLYLWRGEGPEPELVAPDTQFAS
ncbi:virulence-associated E family protein [Microbulbifer hydrolyticus]|uniref:Virulence-associated protein E-like domain-containing protein n=1 Tax=Microbulbifer hydrolyticus TaxID=48074 RepID=A0A6P1TEY8_9GAMM|nr:virulence-associated E family protein [Microbulbifer hydrolyticus]MBB5212621.1 hypothetical protein [Microbulbifer hydrolyticus]QHQ40226.1 hypothetical protein GTQ55_15400 [Microbulbifer hydrolyticus]